MLKLKFSNLRQYLLLMRLDKPIGILLLLWPTLAALWLSARGWPEPDILLIFIFGVIIMRSAGCVINDFADRRIDHLVSRTCQRPLASGKVSSEEALTLFFILVLMAFILVLFLNRQTIFLSVIALVLAIIYPFMKRYTYYPQFFLGLAFSWSIPMAFMAQTQTIPQWSWALYLATICWIIAYDTQYAMVDREDDLKAGIKSTAIVFGKNDKLIIFMLQFLALTILTFIGITLSLGLAFYIGIIAAFCLAIYQQWLIRARQKEKCFQAFLNNNWFGLCLFAGIFFSFSVFPQWAG